MRKPSTLRAILFAAGLSLATGLSPALASTNYVGDLAGLTSVSVRGFDIAYGKSGTLPKGYQSIYVAPVGVIPGQDPVLDALTPADREAMQDYLYRQLTRALGAKFTLAGKPGPGVLVVAASFTELKANKPTQADINRNPGVDYSRSFGIGRAGIQIDLRDGATNELVGAFADHREGEPLTSNLNDIVQWGDAEQFARQWAQALTAALAA